MDHSVIEPLSRVFLQFGPFTLYWYAVFMMSGLTLGVYLAIHEGKKMGINPEFFWDLVLYGFPISILGARLYYVIFNWDFFSQHPERIIRIWEGGLAIHGSLIVAFIFGWFFSKRHKLMPWLIADIAGVSYLIAQAIGRWGNFMNQEAHGGIVPGDSLDGQREFLQALFIPEFVINNMYISDAYYHPAFLYESIWNLIGFLIAVLILRKVRHLLVGELAAFYAIWYSVGRFFVEGIRTDSLMLTDSIKVAQLISIVTVVGVLAIVIGRRATNRNLKTYQSFYVKSTK